MSPEQPADEWTYCANCGEAVRASTPHQVGDCDGPTEDVPCGHVRVVEVERGRSWRCLDCGYDSSQNADPEASS